MDKWIGEESIGFYKVKESSHAPRRDLIPEDLTYIAISMSVPRVSRHEDCIHQADEDRDSLRKEIRLLDGRVRGLD